MRGMVFVEWRRMKISSKRVAAALGDVDHLIGHVRRLFLFLLGAASTSADGSL